MAKKPTVKEVITSDPFENIPEDKEATIIIGKKEKEVYIKAMMYNLRRQGKCIVKAYYNRKDIFLDCVSEALSFLSQWKMPYFKTGDFNFIDFEKDGQKRFTIELVAYFGIKDE
jgi:hypothetical protein